MKMLIFVTPLSVLMSYFFDWLTWTFDILKVSYQHPELFTVWLALHTAFIFCLIAIVQLVLAGGAAGYLGKVERQHGLHLSQSQLWTLRGTTCGVILLCFSFGVLTAVYGSAVGLQSFRDFQVLVQL